MYIYIYIYIYTHTYTYTYTYKYIQVNGRTMLFVNHHGPLPIATGGDQLYE